MLETCHLCKGDFLTEADPYVVRPTPHGVKLYCSCMIVGHDQLSGIEKLQAENKKLREALEYLNTITVLPEKVKPVIREALKKVGRE